MREVPWVAITPAVHAIRTLERIVPPDALLFDSVIHDFVRGRGSAGSLTVETMGDRVEDFVAWPRSRLCS
jgi:hypothetical protein